MIRDSFYRLSAALGFLTVLPAPGAKPESLRACVRFFPLVGLVLGGLLYAQFLILSPLLNPSLNALGLVLTSCILTRGLHLDGLADTADGLLSHQSPARMLEIMRDSRIGTMGALALVFDLLIRWQVWAHCSRAMMPMALIFPPVLGRAAMGAGMVLFTYARESGMASELLHGLGKRDLAGIVLTVGLAAVLLGGLRCLLVVSAVFGLAWILFRLMQRRFGGYTGDMLGAINEMVEVASIVLFATMA